MKKLLMLLVLIGSFLVGPATETFLGYGDMIFDPSACINAIARYVRQIGDDRTNLDKLVKVRQPLVREERIQDETLVNSEKKRLAGDEVVKPGSGNSWEFK